MEEQNQILTPAMEQFVDLLMPELSPYETVLYLLLLRSSSLHGGPLQVRVGLMRLAQGFGRGRLHDRQVGHRGLSPHLDSLAAKGCIRIGDTTREGTLYTVILPTDVPLVAAKLNAGVTEPDDDYFTDPAKRAELFHRDGWTCHYCGEKVREDNATLDHVLPQTQAGAHSKKNLVTACLTCNSIKSGKSYDEAAPLLLKSMQERRTRARNQ